jgi:hypothetical protein
MRERKDIMRTWHHAIIAAAVLALVAGVGCRTETKGVNIKNGHKHDHPDEGPHGGALIELGDEEYHGELVRDPKEKKVTVYILDGEVKDAVPIDAKEVGLKVSNLRPILNLTLKADPQKSDPEGKSSRFVGTHEQLGSGEKLKGEFSVKIAGKDYNNTFNEASAGAKD